MTVELYGRGRCRAHYGARMSVREIPVTDEAIRGMTNRCVAVRCAPLTDDSRDGESSRQEVEVGPRGSQLRVEDVVGRRAGRSHVVVVGEDIDGVVLARALVGGPSRR